MSWLDVHCEFESDTEEPLSGVGEAHGLLLSELFPEEDGRDFLPLSLASPLPRVQVHFERERGLDVDGGGYDVQVALGLSAGAHLYDIVPDDLVVVLEVLVHDFVRLRLVHEPLELVPLGEGVWVGYHEAPVYESWSNGGLASMLAPPLLGLVCGHDVLPHELGG